jgi:Protein of unknown function (DUF4446)
MPDGRQGAAGWLPPRAGSAGRSRLVDSGHPSEAFGIDLDAFARDHLTAILAGLAVAAIVELVLLAWLARRTSRIRSRLDDLTRGHEGVDLATVLDRHLDTVEEVRRQSEVLASRMRAAEEQGRLAFQRIGLVRFNPFEDTGGNQSFALALLDANLDGFVISSLHARSGTRVYVKALAGGRAATQLSSEESEALRQAMSSGGRPQA